jgi:hypothetical protein
MMDNTIAWMLSKPAQSSRERDLRVSAEARELRTILAAGRPVGPVRPSRKPLAALGGRLGAALDRTPTEPSCCPA